VSQVVEAINVPFIARYSNIKAGREFQIDRGLADSLYENVAANPV
jgi:hypothetical protein